LRRYLAAVAALAFLAAAVVLLWGSLQSDEVHEEDAEQRRTVATTTPEHEDLTDTKSYHGTLQAEAYAAVVPMASGTVEEEYVAVGDEVEEGQVLALLDAEEAEMQMAQAEAAVEAAEANVERAQSGSRHQEVEQARAGLEEAESHYETARSQYERNQELYEDGVIAKSDWEEAKTHYETAQAHVQQAEQALQLAEEGTHPDDIRAAEAALKEAQAGKDLAQLRLNHSEIEASRRGAVAEWDLSVGMQAAAGEPVGMIVDKDELRMPIEVGSRDIHYLERGQEVFLDMAHKGAGLLTGYVDTVAPAADHATGMFPVTLAFPNPEGELSPGMYGRAEIITDEVPDALTIPRRAVDDQDGEHHVFVIENGHAERVAVELGIQHGDDVQVKSGIDADTEVVVSGQEQLVPGEAVNVEDYNGEEEGAS